MDTALFQSYFLILLILFLNALYALMPLRDYLRFALKKTAVICVFSLLAISLFFAFLGAQTEIPVKYIFIMSLVPAFGLHMFVTKSGILRRLFTFFNATMITGNGLFYGMIASAPLEKDGNFFTMEISSCLICLLTTVVLGIVYYKTLTVRLRYLVSSEVVNMDYRVALPITIAITTLFYWVMPRYSAVVMTGRVRITIMVFMVLGPLAFLLMYYSMWSVAIKITENSELKESNDLMQLEGKRYRELRQYMEETRNIRHDFRQHIVVMNEYIEAGDIGKLKEYMTDFMSKGGESFAMLSSNPAVDAVASHYDNMARSNDIKIVWRLELPRELPLKESDFITIFGNLVENAINAVTQIKDEEVNKTISVTARMLSEAMLGITVKNPYTGTIKLGKNGLPKSHRPGHGIGLESINVTVKKYNGTLEVDPDDNVFTASALLYIDGSNEK